jgi:hypothetical protein
MSGVAYQGANNSVKQYKVAVDEKRRWSIVAYLLLVC